MQLIKPSTILAGVRNGNEQSAQSQGRSSNSETPPTVVVSKQLKTRRRCWKEKEKKPCAQAAIAASEGRGVQMSRLKAAAKVESDSR